MEIDRNPTSALCMKSCKSAFTKVEMMQNFVVISNKFNLESIFDTFTSEPCAMLCNTEPERICSLLQNSLEPPKFLWSQIYFLHIFRGISG